MITRRRGGRVRGRPLQSRRQARCADSPAPSTALQHQAVSAERSLLPPQSADRGIVTRARPRATPRHNTCCASTRDRSCTRRERQEVGKVTDAGETRRHWALSRGPMLGAAFGLALLVAAIATSSNSVSSLSSLGGLVIVFGGVTAVAFMSFRPDDVYGALNSIAEMLKGAAPGLEPDLGQDMEDIVGWSRIVHGTGMRGLERSLGGNHTADPLLSYGLNLVVSDYAPDDVRAMMQTAADGSYQRACVPVDVLRAMGSHAPAFGMVGTLIGMVSMLHSLTNDVEVIGGTLAVAFLSTLYGVLSARMIYLPAASRLEREVDAQCLRDS